MSADVLSTVVAAARRAAAAREAQVPIESLRARAATWPGGGTDFLAALAAPGIRIIAECKRRSPSKGILRHAYDPVTIATGYAAHGAAAISVLTEPTFFDGSHDHLVAVREAVDIPILRKDFLVTDYQVVEAAALGSHAVLLIVAALDDAGLRRLIGTTALLGMAALVEVHDRAELDRALDAGATVVGVNSRNLRTLEVDPAIFDDLGPRIPGSVVAVAESGLRTPGDLARLAGLRYDGFLIGERFMTENDPGSCLGRLRRDAEQVLASS